MQGWIKLYRKMLKNPVVCKDGDHLAVWVYLLLNATHEEYPMLFKGEKIILKPGQLITGRKSISMKLNVSESKVQRILNFLKSEQQIEQQISNKNRLITILNWSEYQSCEQQDEQQVNNNRTTSEQQVNTNKNVKNNKNVKEERFRPPSTEEVKEYCLKRKNNIDAENFHNFYSAKGWMVGKNKMKDWQAAIRTWEQRDKKSKPKEDINLW